MSQSTYNASLHQIDNDKRDSSCVSLQLPMNLACDHCKKKLDPLTFNRQKKLKKTEIQTSRLYKCHKPWDVSFATTSGKTLQHNKVRTFLNLEKDVTVEYVFAYNKNYTSNPSDLRLFEYSNDGG